MNTPTLSRMAARARELRLSSGDSMIDLSARLSIPCCDILCMERGDAGHSYTAKRVVGHYTGRRNERHRHDGVRQRIQALRQAAGHSQTDLARHLGVKPELIWTVESKPHLSRRTCHRIARFYGVPAAELEVA